MCEPHTHTWDGPVAHTQSARFPGRTEFFTCSVCGLSKPMYEYLARERRALDAEDDYQGADHE